MCILFLRLGGCSQTAVGRNGYKLILGSNRDEHFIRKASPAEFWKEVPHVLAGMDMTSGREGGTWIGINKAGNMGVLTNHRQKFDLKFRTEKGKLRSRGLLVSNFLKENSDPITYSDMLKKGGDSYDSFNTIFGGFTKNGYQCVYINNVDKEQSRILEPGVHGLSNWFIDNTWTKLVVGKQRFSDIVEKDLNKEELISNIMDLLGDDTRYFPNDGGSNINVPEDFAEGISSICVKLPELQYGTRTHTVILIDENNHATFVERTMSDPMNTDNPGWVTNRFEFQIENPKS